VVTPVLEDEAADPLAERMRRGNAAESDQRDGYGRRRHVLASPLVPDGDFHQAQPSVRSILD
jgi:hypothetical protein